MASISSAGAATLQHVRDYVTDYMRTPDLPTAMIDIWACMAMLRIQSEAQWPWLTETQNIVVTRNVDYLQHTTIVPQNDHVTPQAVLSVSVVGTFGGPLERLTMQQAIQRYPDPIDGLETPYYYTVDMAYSVQQRPLLGLRLWPPSTTHVDTEVIVRYRINSPEFPILETGESEPSGDQTIPLPSMLIPPFYNFVLAEALQAEGRDADAQAQLARYRRAVDAAIPMLLQPGAQMVPVGETSYNVGL